jgi:predicted DNA-binding ribbon-helix-helix protein
MEGRGPSDAWRDGDGAVVKRSVAFTGHKRSVSLEQAFWDGLKEIANNRDVTLLALIATIDAKRHCGSLASAIRLFVLNFYRAQRGTQDSALGQAAIDTPIRIRSLN